MSRRKLNVGMIGAGFIGQCAHFVNFAEAADCRILGLAEMRPELRRRVAEKYGIPHAYATHRELLRNPEIDAVVVVTPRAFTAPIVLDCLEAGKHVLSEKPMAGTVEQGERLVKAAAAKGVHYAVGYMKRHDEGVQLGKRLLDEALASGSLGAPLFARAHCYMGDSYCKAGGHVVTDEKAEYADAGWPTAPDWLPAGQAKAYAAYVNTYSHNTNLLRYLFGKTPRIEYSNVSGPAGLAVLDFGGVPATLETGKSSNRNWDEVTEIFFTDGRLTIKTPPALLKNVPAAVELYRAGTTQEITAPQVDWTWSFRRQAEAFVRDSLDGVRGLTPGTDALEDLRLIEELWRRDATRSRA